MKKTLLLIVGLVLVSSVAMAGVSGTAHDMRTWITGGSVTQQVCVFCHTPHQATGITIAPLWNHSMSTVASYGAYTSPTLDVTVNNLGAGTTTTHLCLSCHDGTVGVNSLYKAPGDGDTGASSTFNAIITGGSVSGALNPSAGGYLGTDLSNDHPINFNYADAYTADNAGLLSTPSGSVALIGASGNNVQCASCHQVHDNTNPPFLRMSNINSALCLACHVK